MNISITPLPLMGSSIVPSCMILTNCALIAATFCFGTSKVFAPCMCNYTLETIDIARKLGAFIIIHHDHIEITGIINFPKKVVLGCSAYSTSYIFFSKILETFKIEVEFIGRTKIRPYPVQIKYYKNISKFIASPILKSHPNTDFEFYNEISVILSNFNPYYKDFKTLNNSFTKTFVRVGPDKELSAYILACAGISKGSVKLYSLNTEDEIFEYLSNIGFVFSIDETGVTVIGYKPCVINMNIISNRLFYLTCLIASISGFSCTVKYSMPHPSLQILDSLGIIYDRIDDFFIIKGRSPKIISEQECKNSPALVLSSILLAFIQMEPITMLNAPITSCSLVQMQKALYNLGVIIN